MSTRLRVPAERRMVAGRRSVLAEVDPSPGKCLAVAATPSDPRPSANAEPIVPTRPAFEPKARCWSAMKPPARATSSTGARSTLIPWERRLLPVAAPWPRARTAPRAPISAALMLGGPGMRFTRPPSWSIETITGWRSPRGRSVAWIAAVIRRTARFEPMLSSNRITPASSPAAITRSKLAGARLPSKPQTIRCPASWRWVRSAAARGCGGWAAALTLVGSARPAAASCAPATSAHSAPAIAPSFPGVIPGVDSSPPASPSGAGAGHPRFGVRGGS